MKTFLFFLLQLSLFIHHSASAQRANKEAPGGIPPGPVSRAPGEAFVGEWEWASGSEVFHITLTRNPAYTFPQYPNEGTENVVMGQYTYARNGVTIDQSVSTGPQSYALFCVPADNSSMRMSFKETAKNKYGTVRLTFVAGNPNQLTWELKPKEMLYIYPDVAPTPGFTVPTTLTLTRVP